MRQGVLGAYKVERMMTEDELAIEQLTYLVLKYVAKGAKGAASYTLAGAKGAASYTLAGAKGAASLAADAAPYVSEGATAAAVVATDAAKATHRRYHEWMYPKPVPTVVERLMPTALFEFLKKLERKHAIGLSAIIAIAIIVGLQRFKSMRNKILTLLGLSVEEQEDAIGVVHKAIDDVFPNGFVLVSIRGHPGNVCAVPRKDALEAMKTQGLDVDIDSKDSLQITVPLKMAKDYGRTQTTEYTKAEIDQMPTDSVVRLSFKYHSIGRT